MSDSVSIAPCFTDSARDLSGMTALLLGWRPGDFWHATPDELAAILHCRNAPHAAAAPPDPATITALRKAFPDG